MKRLLFLIYAISVGTILHAQVGEARKDLAIGVS